VVELVVETVLFCLFANLLYRFMTVIYDKVESFHVYLGVMVAQVVVFGHLSDDLVDERLVGDVRYRPDEHFHPSFGQHFYHS
jgi:hypothetical protein